MEADGFSEYILAMQKKEIKELNIVLPQDYKSDISYQVTGFVSEEGLYAIPVVPAAVRCRFDIREKIEEIVKNETVAEQILAIIDEEFPMIMNDFRIKARIDNTLKFASQVKAHQGLF